MNKILTSTFRRLKGEPNLKEGTVYSILIIISVSHFLNDMIQSVVPAIYPIIKTKFGLSFAQIGIITLVFQMSSSILQPLTGLYSDRHPRPYALSIGMCFTLAGIIILAFAGHFLLLLLAVCTIGLGSSIFHPEASRVAQLASGGRKSLAQSIFQVGGNGGSAIGPLLAAAIVLPFGQEAISWFAIAAVAASAIMVRVGSWYSMRLSYATRQPKKMIAKPSNLTGKQVKRALLILVLLIFSKYFYVACIAIGTVAGGMLGDKIGRKYVIWASILGAAPPALAMPFVSLPLTVLLAFLTGLIIASAFSSIVVYATDLMPGKLGLISGIFFGLMFGLGGLGSAFFGWLADQTSISFIFKVSALLPLLGMVAGFLPNVQARQKATHNF